jgi:hypothetical protein
MFSRFAAILYTTYILPSLALAYVIYPYGVDQALKWGDNTVGTPGGVITWSFMPDGTMIDPSFTDPNFSGTSDLTSVFDQIGGTSIATDLINSAFSKWSSVADISFVQVSDDGSPFNGSGAVPSATGHIRIGAFAIDAGVGAVGYAPPPNGGTSLEGDILFNTNSFFQVAAGNEGDPIDLYPESNGYYFTNDFEGLFLHELGHAIGLAHPPDGVQAVMSVDFDIYQYINRELDPDDIAGAQFLYGAAIPESSSIVWLGPLAILTLVIVRRSRQA